MLKEHGSQRPERTAGATGMFDTAQLQPEHAGMRVPSDRSHGAFGHSAAFSLGSLPSNVSLKNFELVTFHSFCLGLTQFLMRCFIFISGNSRFFDDFIPISETYKK